MQRTEKTFAGDRKEGVSVLGPLEARFVARFVERVPRRIETFHLTAMTVVWSAGMVASGWLAASNRWWLFAMSAMVIGQYLTDLFDGAVGRHRGTGLVKWGFFMDHLLDLVFAGSFVIAYSFLAPAGLAPYFLALLLISCALMALSFLSFAATNRFRIAYRGIGPTEIRIGYIAVNTVVFFTGAELLALAVPALVVVTAAALVRLTWSTQRELWSIDMAEKATATWT